MIGRNIGDVEVRGKGTFIVVALCRDDGTTTIHPEQNMVLAEGDAVIVVGGDVLDLLML